MSAASPARLGSGRWRAELGDGHARIQHVPACPAHRLPEPLHLGCGRGGVVEDPLRGGNYTGRSHSLWYADLHAEDELAWYELAFVPGPGRKARR